MRLIDTGSPKVENLHSCPGTGHIPRWKRALDGICMLVSLPLTLPIFLLVALWIKIASPGPIFFRQERVGFTGRRFIMLRFRPMKVNVEATLHEKHATGFIEADIPMTKLDHLGDPRIIPGGRLLRASGLDELPQLFNVFRGEMSLVGPRPCLPFEWERLAAGARGPFNAVPRLTRHWQGYGQNKNTFSPKI